MNAPVLRVLIADDHAPFRDGLHALLRSGDGITVVGEAADGAQAISAAAELQPDVILMDLNMPGVNGIDSTRTIVATSPHIRVLVLTMFDDDDSVFAALRAGARGYLLKGAGRDEMLRSVHAVANGEAVFGAGVAHRIVNFLGSSQHTSVPAELAVLSEREREVLDLIAAGRNNALIAQRLFLSPKTVRNHISNIFSKLQVADRAEAIVKARKAGLGN